jgi:hypothetical protein
MEFKNTKSFDKDILTETKDPLLKEVAKAIKEIKYGAVLITIHDSKVVQIEKTEKMRMQHNKDPV